MANDNPFADQVQELYFHLDHTAHGDTYIAWYGQLRASEYPHHEALERTIAHFNLTQQDWYKARLARRAQRTH